MKKFFQDKISKIKEKFNDLDKDKKDKEKKDKLPNKGFGLVCKNIISLNETNFTKSINPYLDRDDINNKYLNSKNPVFLVSAIGFHHKKGSCVEYTFPSKDEIIDNNQDFFTGDKELDYKIINDIENDLSCLCLPDSVHLSNEDTQFFILQKYKKILFGISCYKQIKTTSKIKDNENTRDCVQKALCILSEIPLFGMFYSKLNMTVSAYFNQETLMNKEILMELYNNYKAITFKNINLNEVFLSFSLKKLFKVCKQKVFTLLKLILCERRIIIYSSKSSNVSAFILALISLIPGLIMFGFRINNELNIYKDSLNQFGLPLHIYNKASKIYPLFTLYDFDTLNTNAGYILGTTTQIVFTNKKTKADLLFNLDLNTFELSDKMKHFDILSKNEKEVWNRLNVTLSNINVGEDWMLSNDNCLESIDDYLRNEIKSYLFNLLTDTALVSDILRIKENVSLLSQEKDEDEYGTSNNSIEDHVDFSYSFKDAKQLKSTLKKILSFYHTDFLIEWSNSYNFGLFNKTYCKQLSFRSRFVKYADNVRILYENGDLYIGEVSYGLRNGKGVLTQKIDNKLFTYSGEFKENKKHGNGTFNSDDGSYVYDGEFINDKIEGIGQLLLNKTRYSGVFKE